MNIYKEAEKRGYRIFYGGRIADTVTDKFLKKGQFSTIEKREMFQEAKVVAFVGFFIGFLIVIIVVGI